MVVMSVSAIALIKTGTFARLGEISDQATDISKCFTALSIGSTSVRYLMGTKSTTSVTSALVVTRSTSAPLKDQYMRRSVTRTVRATKLSEWPRVMQEVEDDRPPPPSTKLEATGPKRIDSMLKQVLHTVWTCQVTTKSDFAREHADFVAMAASMGLISTRIMEEVYGRQWQITSRGLAALESHYGIKTEEDEGQGDFFS